METLVGIMAGILLASIFIIGAWDIYIGASPERKRWYLVKAQAKHIHRLIEAIKANEKALEWTSSKEYLKTLSSIPSLAFSFGYIPGESGLLGIQKKRVLELNKNIELTRNCLEGEILKWRKLVDEFKTVDKATYRKPAKTRVYTFDGVEELEAKIAQHNAKSRA